MKLNQITSSLQKALINVRKNVLTPPPVLNLVEWADKYVYLSPESSSIPGKWKTSTVEAARGPMLEVTNPKVHTISIMASTQLLKTAFINNIVGYHIHQDPAPILVMQPTKSLAETWSKERFDKMVRDTPVLTERVLVKRKGEAENTLYNKVFPGGQVTVIGSNSSTELASRPIRIVLCDEIDKYPMSAGKEGDPLKLVEERTDTFWNALKVRVCSPTVDGKSRIAEEFEKGDQRIYHGLCPHCEEYDELTWEKIKYPQTWKIPDDVIPSEVYYECSNCSALWSEVDRINAINKGKYIAKKEFNGHASFKVNKIASPWNPLSDIVKKYLDSKGSPEKEKTFWNTQMAETWKIKSDAPDWMRLYERRELYNQNSINSKIAFLTCGVDVQGDRFELEIVGWSKDKQTWSVDYRVLPGQTSMIESWKALDKILDETWITPDGRELQIRMLTIDSGYNTQHVYNWVRPKDPNRVRAIRGQDHLQMMFTKPVAVELNYEGKVIKNALQLWNVGVSIIKSDLYSLLRMSGPLEGEDKPGFCHFPQYDENYFRGLCSEHLIETKRNGRTVNLWEKIFERNEPLDVRVYNRAAAAMFGIDRFSNADWDALYGSISEITTKVSSVEGRNQKQNDFWDRGRKRGIW